MIETINIFFANLSNFLWGSYGISNLVIGGGAFFLIRSRLTPFRYLKHGFAILLGKYDNKDDEGQISHFQALSTALSGTVGIGNIAGVALAISIGGPGALFWMWVSSVLGMATKFYTCSLGILFRGRDSAGVLQGGPMYVIEEGMGKKYKFLAYWFSLAGLIGCLSLFQSNQLTQIIHDQIINISSSNFDHFFLKLGIGLLIAFIVALVVFGGINRIAEVASKLVPLMILVYMVGGIAILLLNLNQLLSIFQLILTSAFQGSAVAGGFVGVSIVISQGFRRAAFSNEAGMGTEVMAISATKNNEPIRSGLVAMIGPIIDTLIVCSITGFVILLSNDWSQGQLSGVSLTQAAFENHLGVIGRIIVFFSVVTFGLSTMFGYSYYGCKCASYLFGVEAKHIYRIFYIATIAISAVLSIDLAINILDLMFALMAFPTMISAIYLAPNINKEAKKYFLNLKKGK